jgi:hypothetical protein
VPDARGAIVGIGWPRLLGEDSLDGADEPPHVVVVVIVTHRKCVEPGEHAEVGRQLVTSTRTRRLSAVLISNRT